MGLEIAKVATPQDEAHWLLISGRCTVARFRALAKELRGLDNEGTSEEGEELCTLSVTANREETWLWECTKMLFGHIEGGTTSDLVESVIAEATTSLMPLLPKGAAAPNDLAPSYEAQDAWNRQLAKYREEAERLCDSRAFDQKDTGIGADEAYDMPDFTGSSESIDRKLRQISGELAGRDIVIGELAERFWKANGWRRLGYATETQYARERLGAGISFIKDHRKLACQLNRLPYVKRALAEGDIGYEAARIVAGVATPATDAVWAERARRRTLVHLGEDLRVAELVSRVELRAVVEPPSDELVAEARALQRAVVTGTLFRESAAPPALRRKSAGDGTRANDAALSRKSDESSLWSSFTEARRAPPEIRARAREVIRLRVRPEIRAMYRGLERLYLRHQPRPMSFFQFICLTFVLTWARELPRVAYADIYARDGLRCTNPTCTRRDCQPHHIVFRAHGGSDEPENLTTLCTRCHLEGVHGGRISVTGRAPHLEWRIGRHTTIIGRERHRAA